MKKFIFTLLALIFVNSLTAQSKCEENPIFTESEIIKSPSDVKHRIGNKGKFYYQDGVVICNEINRNTYLVQAFDKTLKLKVERELKFNDKKNWGFIETVLKKDDGYYFYIIAEGRKKHLFYEKKYDLALNLVSDKLILEISDNDSGSTKILAYNEELLGLKFYNDDANFKITYVKKKEVFVVVFDKELNKINEYSYNDEYKTITKANATLKASYTSNDGSLYTLYTKPAMKLGKLVNPLTIRKISTNGDIKTNELELKGISFEEGHFVKSLETSEEFTFVLTSSKNSKTYINGLSVITYKKSDLSVVSSDFIPIKKHKVKIPYSKYNYVKFEENKNDLYIGLEENKNTSVTRANGRGTSFLNFGNISIYRLNLASKTLDWETKISKKNENVYYGPGSGDDVETAFIGYSWVVKDEGVFVFLNSSDKRTNNVFITKGKKTLFDKKVIASSLYALKINTETGKFCHKKFKENANVLFHVKYGSTEDNSLIIIGENRKEKTYQILKF